LFRSIQHVLENTNFQNLKEAFKRLETAFWLTSNKSAISFNVELNFDSKLLAILYFQTFSAVLDIPFFQVKNELINGLLKKTNLFYHGIHLLLGRWEKVVTNKGKYFEI